MLSRLDNPQEENTMSMMSPSTNEYNPILNCFFFFTLTQQHAAPANGVLSLGEDVLRALQALVTGVFAAMRHNAPGVLGRINALLGPACGVV